VPRHEQSSFSMVWQNQQAERHPWFWFVVSSLLHD
jgi:hypothetical protein